MRLLHQITAIMPIYLLYCQELKSQYSYLVGTAFFPKPKVPLIISTHYLQKSAFTVELGYYQEVEGGETGKGSKKD
jgi:hypothetical protein